MGFPTLESIFKDMFDLAKGTISLGNGLMASWDFTEGLTKEQWAKKKEEEHTGVYIRNGRIIIPNLGII